MSKFFDISSPSTAPTTVVGDMKSAAPQLHRLPAEWCFWHHQRCPLGKGGEDGKEENEDKGAEEKSAITPDGNGDKLNSPKSDATNSDAAKADGEESDADQSKIEKLEHQYVEGTNLVSFPSVKGEGETSTVDTVEQFWQCMSNLAPVQSMDNGTELFFFRKGVKPMWEDPINAKGGRWIFRFEKRYFSDQQTGLIWERLLLKLISGTFIPQSNFYADIIEKDVCGVTLSVRGDQVIIKIWNTHQEYFKYLYHEAQKYMQDARALRLKFQAEEVQEKQAEDALLSKYGKKEKEAGEDDEDGESDDSDDSSKAFNDLLESLEPELREEFKRRRRNLQTTEKAVKRLIDDKTLRKLVGKGSYFSLEEERNQNSDVKATRDFRNMVKLTPFILRHGISDAMMMILAEVDLVLKSGENPITVRAGNGPYARGLCSGSRYRRHFIWSPKGGEVVNREEEWAPTGRRYRGKNYGNNGGSFNNSSGSTTGGDEFPGYRRRRRQPHGDNKSHDDAYTFHRRTHFSRGEHGKDSQGFEVQPGGRRNGYTRRYNHDNGRSNHESWHRGSGSERGHESDEVQDEEKPANQNSFAALGKQRKKLEFNEDGKLVEEVNMLSFGSRRRRMLQMQREHK